MTDPKEAAKEIKVRCPKCGAEVKLDAHAQQAMVVKCPKGHAIELMKAI